MPKCWFDPITRSHVFDRKEYAIFIESVPNASAKLRSLVHADLLARGLIKEDELGVEK